MLEKKYNTIEKRYFPCKILVTKIQAKMKNLQRTWGTRVFARGPPPHYWLGPTMLDCADRTGCGMFIVVWPKMLGVPYTEYIYTTHLVDFGLLKYEMHYFKDIKDVIWHDMVQIVFESYFSWFFFSKFLQVLFQPVLK